VLSRKLQVFLSLRRGNFNNISVSASNSKSLKFFFQITVHVTTSKSPLKRITFSFEWMLPFVAFYNEESSDKEDWGWGTHEDTCRLPLYSGPNFAFLFWHTHTYTNVKSALLVFHKHKRSLEEGYFFLLHILSPPCPYSSHASKCEWPSSQIPRLESFASSVMQRLSRQLFSIACPYLLRDLWFAILMRWCEK
jgi:hypothetical protein